VNDQLELSSNATNLKIDEEWFVQGRIIPPSCTKGEGCLLHLQAQRKGWETGHFHTGRSNIPPEMGVELVTSLLIPIQDMLICSSMDAEEQEHQIEYLSMVKLVQPTDTIGFMTTNGLIYLIQIQGLNSMFGISEKCKYCLNTISPTIGFDGNLDSLMLVNEDERSH